MGVLGQPADETKKDIALVLLFIIANIIAIPTLVAGIVYWAGAGVKVAVGSFAVLTYLHLHFRWWPLNILLNSLPNATGEELD